MHHRSFPSAPIAWLLVIVLVLLTQANSYRDDIFGWDEFTFIQMGQEVADGYLPYARLYDNKPPLVFALIGAVISIFGKNLLAIRMAGDLLIVACAMIAFSLGRRLTSAGPALCAALLLVACCAGAEGQPMMSEWPAAAFLGAACLMLARNSVSLRDCALTGVFMALAVLARTNLAVPTVLLGVLLMAAPRLGWAFPRSGYIAYAASGLLTAALAFAPYVIAGQTELLLASIILAPLAYAEHITMADTIGAMAGEVSRILDQYVLIMLPVLVLAVMGVWRGLALFRSSDDPCVRRILAVATTLGGGTIVSMLLGGAAYAHYWFQILVFLALAFALTLGDLLSHPGRMAWLAMLVAVPLGTGIALHARSIASLVAEPGENANNGAAYAAASHILQRREGAQSVWAISNHLVLWHAGIAPVSALGTHPSNLGHSALSRVLADHGMAQPDELDAIMARKPEVIISDTDGWGKQWLSEARPGAAAWLERNYLEEAHFDKIVILRRVRT